MSRETINSRALLAIVDSSAAINSAATSDEVLHAIARFAVNVMRCEGASVIIVDDIRHKQVFRVVIGDKAESLLNMELDIESGISGLCMRRRRSIVVNEATRHRHHYKGVDKKIQFSTQNLIAAPLICHEKILGVLEVVNSTDGHSFTDEDADICKIFANLAAIAINNAKMLDELRLENAGLHSQQEQCEMVGAGSAMQTIRSLIERVATTDSTVFIIGETGTGKEVTAHEIHAKSKRCDGPFIAVNCAALPETLLESELFGHEVGAFTGATASRPGRFELANGGTIFLDEVTEMSPDAQAKLLRVLQQREVMRIGATHPTSCDVRVLAASNRDMAQAVAAGKFREDLYYRLNVFPIHLPPLRHRIEDIPALAKHFLCKLCGEMNFPFAKISPEAMQLLQLYNYPGNIRELQNIIERAMLLARPLEDPNETAVITPAHLPYEIVNHTQHQPTTPQPTPDEPQLTGQPLPANQLPTKQLLEAQERQLIIDALVQTRWNKSRAAQLLNMSRDNLRYRIKKYQLERSN